MKAFIQIGKKCTTLPRVPYGSHYNIIQYYTYLLEASHKREKVKFWHMPDRGSTRPRSSWVWRQLEKRWTESELAVGEDDVEIVVHDIFTYIVVYIYIRQLVSKLNSLAFWKLLNILEALSYLLNSGLCRHRLIYAPLSVSSITGCKATDDECGFCQMVSFLTSISIRIRYTVKWWTGELHLKNHRW